MTKPKSGYPKFFHIKESDLEVLKHISEPVKKTVVIKPEEAHQYVIQFLSREARKADALEFFTTPLILKALISDSCKDDKGLPIEISFPYYMHIFYHLRKLAMEAHDFGGKVLCLKSDCDYEYNRSYSLQFGFIKSGTDTSLKKQISERIIDTVKKTFFPKRSPYIVFDLLVRLFIESNFPEYSRERVGPRKKEESMEQYEKRTKKTQKFWVDVGNKVASELFSFLIERRPIIYEKEIFYLDIAFRRFNRFDERVLDFCFTEKK